MKKILFPTDFSETSINAFVYALKLAENINAEVITLHVYELPIIESNYIDIPLYQAEVYQSLELSNFENYKDQVPVLRNIAVAHRLEQIKISNIMLQGDLVHSILELVKEENIDYVVMGTKGASGIKEVFFGSATANVMTGTKAYVLGIPEGSGYEPIRKIGFTTQFHDDDLKAFRKVIEVARGFGAEIECLYVKTSDNEVNEVCIADWKLLFKDEKVTFHIKESNEVEETITNFISKNKINLLAMLNHRHGFWEGLFHHNLTKKLAYHIKIPLLALHEE